MAQTQFSGLLDPFKGVFRLLPKNDPVVIFVEEETALTSRIR